MFTMCRFDEEYAYIFCGLEEERDIKMNDELILVDSQDRVIGYGEKLEVHQKELLHRAFSIFIFDRTDQTMLIQKRAAGKYHSGGLWTNACCSHPRKGETMETCLSERVKEELGLKVQFHIVDPKTDGLFTEERNAIYSCGSFIYLARFDGLSEHEIDHVFLYCPLAHTFAKEDFVCNPEEIEDSRWVTMDELDKWMAASPEEFTAWFGKALELVRKRMGQRKYV